MATKYVIQVDVNAQGAITNADEVAKKLEQANTAAGSAAGGMNALRKELKAVESELAGLDPNSEKFAEISNRAGEIKDRMKDIKEAVGNQAGPAVEVFGNNLGKLKGDLANLDFEGATSAIRGMGSAVKGFSFKDLIGGIKDLGSTFLSLGRVLLTNPLFLLATIIPIIVSNFESLTKAGGFIGDMFRGVKNIIDDLTGGFKTLTDFIGLTNFAAQEAAENSIKAAEKIKEATDKIQSDIEQRQAETVKKAGGLNAESLKIERERAQGIIDEADRQIAAYEGLITAGKKLTASQTETLNYYKQEREKEAAALIAFEATVTKEINAKAKENSENAQRIAREREDVILALEAGSYKARLILIDRYYDELKKKANGSKEELRAIEIAKQNELAVLNGQKETNEKNTQEQIGAIQSIGIQSQGIVLSQGLQAREATIQQSNSNITQLTEEELAKQQARDAEIMQMRIDTVNNGLSTIANLSTLFAGKSEKSQRRAFEIQKKVQIAAALVDTYKSATAAYASQIIPGDPSSPVRGAIAAAAAITAGLVNVNNIRKQQFGGGGGSAAGGGGAPQLGGGGSAPAFSVTNNTDVGERPAQQAIKTYVLASDVTNNQEATEKIESRTRIG
jgi:hypothetical protein